MKYFLGLFYLISVSSLAYSASSSLVLRGQIQPTFKVDFSTGTPRLLTNLKDGSLRPQLKVEKQLNGYVITVIQP